LDQVEEELISAVKKLRVLGEQAEGEARKERLRSRRSYFDVADPASVEPKRSSYKDPTIDDMKTVPSRWDYRSEEMKKRRGTGKPSRWDCTEH